MCRSSVFCVWAAAAPRRKSIAGWTETGKRTFPTGLPGAANRSKFFDSRHDGIKPEKVSRSAAKSRTGQSRQGEKVITAEDYQISAAVSQSQDLVCLSGRISDGPACKRLKVDFYVQDGDGHLVHLIDIAEDLGGFMSDLLETSRRVKYGDSRSQWSILSISATCLRPE